MEETKT